MQKNICFIDTQVKSKQTNKEFKSKEQRKLESRSK